MTEKYSVILKRISPIVEIECTKCLYTHDRQGNLYLNFKDTEGRWWVGEKSEFIIINNCPSEKENQRWEQLKQEAIILEEMENIEYTNAKRKLDHDVQFA